MGLFIALHELPMHLGDRAGPDVCHAGDGLHTVDRTRTERAHRLVRTIVVRYLSTAPTLVVVHS